MAEQLGITFDGRLFAFTIPSLTTWPAVGVGDVGGKFL